MYLFVILTHKLFPILPGIASNFFLLFTNTESFLSTFWSSLITSPSFSSITSLIKIFVVPKTTLKSTGVSGYIWELDNKVNGYKALVTNQIADGDVFLGNFADLILGMFGGLELIVDPYTYSNKGGVQITAFQDVDYGARHAASFCLGANTASVSGS